MPSPLAHGAVGLMIWPLLARGSKSRRGRAAVGGMLTLGVLGPDLDIPAGMVLTGSAFASHGGVTHSLFAGVLFGVVFATICSRYSLLRWSVLWLLGSAAWCSHVLLDACTTGRGVAMCWPLSVERVSLPVPLFYGVRHSEPWAWQHHLMTVVTEFPFVVLMAVLGTVIARLVRARRGSDLTKHPRIEQVQSA